MNYIILNGVNSNTITGLIIQELPPISKPLMRTQIDQIDGRDGDIVTKLGYSTVDKELSIGLHGNFDIDSVIEYFASEGTVIFSNEPDKYYRYQVLEQIDFERLVRFRTATVTMHCQPFKYEVNEDPIEENSTVEEDSVPYAFRKSPYGDREFDEIVGGSIAWNQCYPTANINVSETSYTVVSNNDGKWTITVTAQTTSVGHNYQWVGATTFIANHVYAFLGGNGNIKIQLKAYDKSSDTIFKPTTSAGNNVTVVFTNLAVGTYVVYPQLFDLTQMFGSSVADAIYAMEQSSSGSGVAFFRGLFPKPYYAYNAGQLISVSGLSAHKMTGFNQLSLEGGKGTLSGYANTTPRAFEYDKYYIGLSANNYYNESTVSSYHVDSTTREVTATASSNGYGVAFPIRVFANTNYYVTATVAKGNVQIRIGYYDESGVLISYSPANVIGQVVTTPVNCKTMVVVISTISASETFTLNNICINISGERNGEYEPYEVHSYALDDSLTLRGIPKLNSANEMYFDGDIYSSDGTVQRRYAIVDMSTLTWDYNGTRFRAFMETAPTGAIVVNASVGRNKGIQAKYPMYNGSVADAPDKSFIFGSGVDKYAYIKDSAYTDVQALITSLSGVYLVYKLQTPTTESAEPYQNPQICNEYGTEEYVSAEQSGVTMIVGHNTEYSSQISATIINNGNTEARPTLTISGVGDVIVLLNGQQIFQIALGDTGNITIDAEQMEAYHGGLLRNRLVTGDYNNFVLQSGENVLQFVGYVTSAEITNYSRWL